MGSIIFGDAKPDPELVPIIRDKIENATATRTLEALNYVKDQFSYPSDECLDELANLLATKWSRAIPYGATFRIAEKCEINSYYNSFKTNLLTYLSTNPNFVGIFSFPGLGKWGDIPKIFYLKTVVHNSHPDLLVKMFEEKEFTITVFDHPKLGWNEKQRGHCIQIALNLLLRAYGKEPMSPDELKKGFETDNSYAQIAEVLMDRGYRVRHQKFICMKKLIDKNGKEIEEHDMKTCLGNVRKFLELLKTPAIVTRTNHAVFFNSNTNKFTDIQMALYHMDDMKDLEKDKFPQYIVLFIDDSKTETILPNSVLKFIPMPDPLKRKRVRDVDFEDIEAENPYLARRPAPLEGIREFNEDELGSIENARKIYKQVVKRSMEAPHKKRKLDDN